MKAWRVLIAVVACLGPALQYGLMIYDESWATGPVKTIEFFSYFTIISNVLAAVALTAPLVAPGSAVARWAEASTTRIALAVYLAITALIYHTLLAHAWDLTPWRRVSSAVQHTVTPALFLIDWLWRGGQGEARWSAALKALRIPALYGAWTVVHGALSGFYPYPFLNVAKRGYPSVLLTLAVMFLGFLLIALAFTALHRARAKLALGHAKPISA
jgi:hypothetical protein